MSSMKMKEGEIDWNGSIFSSMGSISCSPASVPRKRGDDCRLISPLMSRFTPFCNGIHSLYSGFCLHEPAIIISPDLVPAFGLANETIGMNTNPGSGAMENLKQVQKVGCRDSHARRKSIPWICFLSLFFLYLENVFLICVANAFSS